jgi:hypothetical protein
MYRRFFALMSLALCGVLAGCSSATTISVHAGKNLFIGPIQASFRISQPGIYHYVLTFVRVPPEAGAQPQICIPRSDFDLTRDQENVETLPAPSDTTGEVSGSLFFAAGTWTGVNGYWASSSGVVLGAQTPGTFTAVSCPWSLALTLAN